MTIIGLTGSFGTGKTFAASVFKTLGAMVIDADRLAKESLKKGASDYKKIVKAFGGRILDKNLNIEKRALAGIVFNDKSKLKKLNAIIHPTVIKKIKREIKSAPSKAIVIDAPLLVEANLSGIVDYLVVMKASKANQIKRIALKTGMKKKDILNRIKSQMPLKEKTAMADFVIDNNGSRKKTEKEVKMIWRKIYGNS